MSTELHKQTAKHLSKARATWSKVLIRFCGYGLIFSSCVKLLHPPKVVAYMASMGFEGGTFFFVAVLELFCAVLFLIPATRRVGLLLVSSYLGGAIAAHLATHRFFEGGPFLVYMASHPYVGALAPAMVLVAGWIGTWIPGGAPALQYLSYKNLPAKQASQVAVGQAL